MWMSFYVAVLAVLLIQAHAQPGFISIDCGAEAGVNYYDSTFGINYVSDAYFINTGVSETIASEEINRYDQQLRKLRSFPEGKRNCYKISVTRGSKYLIRTVFLYGNYDGRNMAPKFDLLLGPSHWDTVNINNASRDQSNEIIHVPSRDYVQICLVDTGNGTPFITAIEFRTLNSDTYVTQFGSLETYLRCDLGSDIMYRYPDDVYDRYWYPCNFSQNWKLLSASIPDNGSSNLPDYKPGRIVMSTAVTPENDSAPLVISWEPQYETDQFYVYMHFTELFPTNQTRQFNIRRNGDYYFSPRYHVVDTIYTTSAISGKVIKYSLERTQNSTLPPIISAIEIYRVIDLQKPQTSQGDVDAITSIKSAYGVKRDWEGDPCAPAAYLWDGLKCNYDNVFQRITTLDLSSSGLSGFIHPAISNLTMLEKLDLSNNNLRGVVPYFLSQLQHLKILNLEKNYLTGSVPSALVQKSREGSLSLSVGQYPYLSEYGQFNEKKKTNIAIPIVPPIGGVLFIVVAIVAIDRWIKRKKSKDSVTVNHQIEISQQSTEEDNEFQGKANDECDSDFEL